MAEVVVRVVSVLLTCKACGQATHLEMHRDSAYDRAQQPLGSWWVAHVKPRMTHVELTVDGRPAVWRTVTT